MNLRLGDLPEQSLLEMSASQSSAIFHGLLLKISPNILTLVAQGSGALLLNARSIFLTTD